MTVSETSVTKLLVVGDDPALKLSLCDLLARKSYDVLIATSRIEAIELLLSESITVLIVDLVMEKKDGFDILREIGSNDRLSQTPVLVLTDATGHEELLARLDLSIENFIVKPWDEYELLCRLRSMVRLNHSIIEARNAQQTTKAANSELEQVNQQLYLEITERKRLEQQLAQAQKLDSVGQLAAGIAHEINTPTQYVSDNTWFLKEAFGDIGTVLDRFEKLLQAAKDDSVDEQLVAEVEATLKQVDLVYLTKEIPQAIDQSLNGVEQVSKIVRAMKEFSHPGGEEKSLVNLTEVIETTITVARNEWKYVAEMVTEFDPELPDVSCLPSELNQVFLNLIVNAAHAIAEKSGDDATEKGTITVGTRHDGECVEIFVRDTGTGIPEEVRVRIFDPFFTTKEVGKGTGQGLAIARSIVVDKHGGTIDCQTEPGKGTTFIVRLPIDGNRKLEGQEMKKDAHFADEPHKILARLRRRIHGLGEYLK